MGLPFRWDLRCGLPSYDCIAKMFRSPCREQLGSHDVRKIVKKQPSPSESTCLQTSTLNLTRFANRGVQKGTQNYTHRQKLTPPSEFCVIVYFAGLISLSAHRKKGRTWPNWNMIALVSNSATELAPLLLRTFQNSREDCIPGASCMVHTVDLFLH